MTTALLAILLACLLPPASALAVSTQNNDNHTDTEDYCLRAHDVTIGLSAFQNQSRAELENDIVSAASFAFLIRDTANETGTFVPVSSGYSVDFSNLTEAVSSSGYTVTVTLPAITMPEPSRITFRVFVTDDLPRPRTVHYVFESGTTEHTLPANVTALLPADESILSGTTVTPSGAFSPLRDGNGEWTFFGWTPESITLSDSDVTFTGTWIRTQLPAYNVTFSFVSGTPGRTLPDGVLAKLPAQAIALEGDVVSAPPTFRAFHLTQGTWRFHGWNGTSCKVSGQDVAFIGEWRWHEAHTVIAPTTEATATSASTQTPTATPFAAAVVITSSPAQSPDSSQEQILNDMQMPAANSTAGGTAQMVIATVLTALVAAQAFAIAGDLKVLKWYNAKKAARRAGA